MTDLTEKAVLALISAAIGWGANALTVVGRVDAMERIQTRIEAQIDRMDTRMKLILQRIDPTLDYATGEPMGGKR